VRAVSILLPIVLSVLTAQAQTDTSACNAEPDIQQIYYAHRNSPDRADVMRKALAAEPNKLFLNYWLITTPGLRPGSFAAEYKAKLAEHRDEPLFLFLYAQALLGADTPQAIRLLDQALEKDPDIPYAYLAQLTIYTSARFRDRTRVASALKAYYSRCPGDVNTYKYLSEVDDPEVLKEMTPKFRQAVEKRNTVGVAAVYPHLWAAEFRIADSKTHDKLREQIRIDMQRIRELDPKNVNGSKSLIEGYRLLGDETAATAMRAERTPAPKRFFDVFDEWNKAHPYPRTANPEALAQYQEEMYKASAEWVKGWPEETNAWYWRLNAVANLKGSTPNEIEKAGEDVIASDGKTFMGWSSSPYPMFVAEIWEAHDIRLRDCLALLQRAQAQFEGTSLSYDDLRPATSAATIGPPHNVAYTQFRIWGSESRVHLRLKELDAMRSIVTQMKDWIEQHPDDSSYTKDWHDQAGALAEAEGHKPDALTHYQQGRQMGQYREHAKALWNNMGGTAEGFKSWFRPVELPKNPVANMAVPWATKDRPLASLNAHDLSGNTWTVADLKGKKTLINVWATWCGPCRDELPFVQKLYEQTKDRKDVQVITISIDENVGLLAPFMKAQKYTFPVLEAKTLVDDITATVAVPRNWIVDAGGVLRQEGIGFDKADWPDKILSRLSE
jgi:thiol-disulfide isomerase/thioredoxin